jgi:hypothetical protein
MAERWKGREAVSGRGMSDEGGEREVVSGDEEYDNELVNEREPQQKREITDRRERAWPDQSASASSPGTTEFHSQRPSR